MIRLFYDRLLKHSTPNRPLKLFVNHSYKENAKLCIVNCMQFYLGEGNCKLMITTKISLLCMGNHITTPQQTTFRDGLKRD